MKLIHRVAEFFIKDSINVIIKNFVIDAQELYQQLYTVISLGVAFGNEIKPTLIMDLLIPFQYLYINSHFCTKHILYSIKQM